MRTEDLIAGLCQDLSPRPSLGRVYATGVALGLLVAGTLFFLGLGVRPDLGAALGTARFAFKLAITLALAGAAVGLLLPLSRPGAAPGAWAWALAAVPVLLAAAVAGELAVMPEATWWPRLVGSDARHCLVTIPLLSAGPLACLLGCLHVGAPTRPGLAGAVAGLAAGGIGASFYGSYCPDDSPLFIATWYVIATAAIAMVGFLAGRALPRW